MYRIVLCYVTPPVGPGTDKIQFYSEHMAETEAFDWLDDLMSNSRIGHYVYSLEKYDEDGEWVEV